MTRLTITPWRYASDLVQVRQQLYKLGAADERQDAVDRVLAWRLRGNLPHAVESTALLVDAIIHHNNPGNSSFSVRAVYAAAFCRFVTGYCDIGRNKEKSLESSSMLEIARQIEMPLEFVALRHEATHEEYPSEARIVGACEQALQWLWKVYWSRLDTETYESPTKDAIKTITRQLFKEHRTAVKAYVKTPFISRSQSHTRAEDAGERVGRFLSQVHLSKEACDAVAGEVVDSKVLIPNGPPSDQDLTGAFFIWSDLLLVFSSQSPQLFLAIIDAMLSTLNKAYGTDAHRMWLLHLTQLVPSMAAHVLKHCVLHSSRQTLMLGQEILESVQITSKDQWSELLEASRTDHGQYRGRASEVLYSELRNEEPEGRWHKMILEPSVPIGVIP